MKFLILFGLVLFGFIFVGFFDDDLAFAQLNQNTIKVSFENNAAVSYEVPLAGEEYTLTQSYSWVQDETSRIRHDEVDTDNGPLFAGTILEDPGRNSTRDSFMIEWSPSEFSRLRMQFINDRVLDESDSQFLLQYIMSVGAHGGHEF